MKIFLLLYAIFIILQVNFVYSSENNDSFVATKEWQEINKGINII